MSWSQGGTPGKTAWRPAGRPAAAVEPYSDSLAWEMAFLPSGLTSQFFTTTNHAVSVTRAPALLTATRNR